MGALEIFFIIIVIIIINHLVSNGYSAPAAFCNMQVVKYCFSQAPCAGALVTRRWRSAATAATCEEPVCASPQMRLNTIDNGLRVVSEELCIPTCTVSYRWGTD